jgi:hypothetical protein
MTTSRTLPEIPLDSPEEIATKTAILRLAEAFAPLWDRARDVMGALDAVQAAIAGEERRLASLQEQVAEARAEHARLQGPLATLARMKQTLGA